MFNRLVKATRSVFSFRSERQLQLPDRTISSPSSPQRSDQGEAEGMVTTRSQTDHAQQTESITGSGQKRKTPRDQNEHRPSKKSKSAAEQDLPTEQDETSKTPELPIRAHAIDTTTTSQRDVLKPTSEAVQGRDTPDSTTHPRKAQSAAKEVSPSAVEDTHTSTVQNGVTAKKSNHVRFDSEEPPSQPPPKAASASQTLSEERPEVLEDSSSDDDGPETLTAAESRYKAQASTVGASKAIRSQEESRREIRRKKDAKLREQARAAASNRTKKEKNVQVPETKPVDTNQLARDILQSGEIPDILPPEILKAERVDTVLASVAEGSGKSPARSKSPKKKSQKAKDIVRNDRLVRILDQPEDNKLLVSSSKGLREAWLMGQRGRHDTVASHRKPFHQSFLKG